VRPRVGADDAAAGAHSGKTGCWPVPVKTGQRRKAACEPKRLLITTLHARTDEDDRKVDDQSF
jgi:hypothetical protein